MDLFVSKYVLVDAKFAETVSVNGKVSVAWSFILIESGKLEQAKQGGRLTTQVVPIPAHLANLIL